MAKTYIIDGNSLLFRCFFSTFRPGAPVMSAKDGTPTNALYGFAQMIGHIRSELKDGDRMIVCFDTGHPTFRSEEIKEYKAQRKPIEPALKIQIPLAHEMMAKMGIEYAEMEKYEGDDVAGSLAKYAQNQGDEVILFTSDKDFLQLLDDHIQIHALKKGLTDIIEYTKDNVKEKFGCRADQIVDFKAIAGDASDNYKGIPGIGEKTALKLLEKYDHLEDILKAYKDDMKSGVGRHLNEGAKDGELCLKIATIKTDLDVKKFYEEGLVKEPDLKALRDFFKKYDMNKFVASLDKKLHGKNPSKDERQMTLEEVSASSEEKAIDIPEVKTIADLDEMDSSPVSLSVALDGKLSMWNENVSKILGYVLASEKGTIYFINSKLVSSATHFKKWVSNDDKKDSLDSKSCVVALARMGLETKAFGYDFLLASYLIDSDRAATLADALEQHGYQIPDDPIQRIVGGTLVMEKTKKAMLMKIQEDGQLPLLREVELPLALTLADMEIEGMPLDKKTLDAIGAGYKKKLTELESTIKSFANDPAFNVNSPSQVYDLLFHTLGLVPTAKEKGSSIEVLNNHLAEAPDVIQPIIDYRTYSKIVNGYIDALPKHYDPKDGKIHAIINQTLTSTGRLSMSEPNLQNISIKKDEGKELRKAFFFADPDYEFMSYDYSQVEIRVLAALGNIQVLKNVCASGEDIHKATASEIYKVPLDQVTSSMRRNAKTVNFGIIYGISTFGLKERLGLSFQEANELIKLFYTTFPGVKAFEEKCISSCHINGYVTTILNRRRYIPSIKSPIAKVREAAERMAVNAVVQGSAADLIKVAMNKVHMALKGKKTKIILQIHDELVFKLYKPEEKELLPLISDIMDGALKDKLDVKLQVEGNVGHSWYDCK